MRDRPRILFVEDEQSISAPFSKALEREGFEPHVAATAARALELQESLEPDLILLDLHLPDGDGRDVCRTIRARSGVPIIILTARGTETDRIVGLELGADDYVVKPFSGPEVIARMRAVLRRVQPAEPEAPEAPITIGELHVDLAARRATLAGEELSLSRKEFDLLAELDPQRRPRRHPRGDDGPRLGRELVRLHQDARRPRPLAARQARGDGRERDVPAHGARRRLPLPRARGARAVTLRTRLLLALAYVLLLAIVALEVPLALNLRDRVDGEVKSQALSQAEVAAATASGQLRRPDELRRIVGTIARSARGRVIITDRRGVLVADSDGAAQLGVSYASRPEVAAALRRRTVQDTRRSDTLDEEILATAVPVLNAGRVEGAVRITQSVAAVRRATRRSIFGLVAVGGLVLLLGLGAGALIARQIARPMGRLEAAAARLGHGDLSTRVPVEGSAEQQGLANTFNEMGARLERLVESQREFVADASHQLRTPLAGLQLRLEEAQATGDPEEIEAALKEVDRLSAMVSELLLLSQAGEVDAPAEEIDLGAAARKAAARFDERVSALSGAPTPPVHCAPADLERTLDALVENALHYGGGTVTLVARPGAIDVLDDGPGIDAQELEAVFERFHRGKAGRAGPPGTGLGLPIARELMRRWGGDVTLANREGGGAAATISFDRA